MRARIAELRHARQSDHVEEVVRGWRVSRDLKTYVYMLELNERFSKRINVGCLGPYVEVVGFSLFCSM